MSAKLHAGAAVLISSDMGPEHASRQHASSPPLRSAISVELRYSDGAPPTEAVTGAVCPGQTYSLQVSERKITHGVFSIPVSPAPNAHTTNSRNVRYVWRLIKVMMAQVTSPEERQWLVSSSSGEMSAADAYDALGW